MNIVGPRPERPTIFARLRDDIPEYHMRQRVKPGITGWAQINQGYAHEAEEMRHKLEYDLYYLKHCSLWLDVMIVLRTFAVMFGGTGAR